MRTMIFFRPCLLCISFALLLGGANAQSQDGALTQILAKIGEIGDMVDENSASQTSQDGRVAPAQMEASIADQIQAAGATIITAAETVTTDLSGRLEKLAERIGNPGDYEEGGDLEDTIFGKIEKALFNGRVIAQARTARARKAN